MEITVTSRKFQLRGRYTVEKVQDTFYKFKDDEGRLYIPAGQIRHVHMVNTDKDRIRRVRSTKYKLSGTYAVTEYKGIYYKFSRAGKDTYVPERDIESVKPGSWWKKVPLNRRRTRRRTRRIN